VVTTPREVPPRLKVPEVTIPTVTVTVPPPGEIVESLPTTTTTSTVRPSFEPFLVTARHGYWIAEPDEPRARWLMPLVNSGDSWSPDGTQIVHRSTPSTISITDVRTGDRRTLADGSGSRGDPRWSPDGRHVAINEGQSGRSALVIVDVAGKEVARFDDWVDGQNGYAWSPDGARIAYASFDSGGGSAWLSIASLGGEVERVATGDADSRFLGLVWSPRGTHLGWTFDEKLHLLRLADRRSRTLDVGGMPVYGHAWSPDEALVYPWGPSLHRMLPDGTDGVMLDGAGHSVTVEPVTGRLAWASGYGVGRTTAIVSGPGGADARVALRTAPDAGIDGVQWSPAGRQFLFIQYGGG
jgi:dipeptidyl aminopeptidase/acylaminoacyl peptidase